FAHHVLSHLSAGAAALVHIDAALDALGSTVDPDAVELRMLLLNNRLAQLNNLGRRQEFEATVSEALILASRIGPGRAALVQMAAAMGCYDFGAWDEVLVHAESLTPPLSTASMVVRSGVLALVAAHREDWARAKTYLEEGATIRVTPGDVRVFSGYLIM